MSEANKSLVRRLIEEAVNKGNFKVMDEILSTDYVYREPTAGEKRGRAGYQEIVTMYRNAFPDIKLTIEEQLPKETRSSHGRAEAEHIAVNCSVRHQPESV